jgi:hypothetical protein
MALLSPAVITDYRRTRRADRSPRSKLRAQGRSTSVSVRNELAIARTRMRSRDVADVALGPELDVAAVCGAGRACPLCGAGLVDAEALGEDRCRESTGEGE